MRTGLSRLWTRFRSWVIAVLVTASLLVTALAEDRPATDLDVLGYALVAIGGLALAAGRRAPVPVLIVTGLCAVGYNALGFAVPAVAYLFAVYAAVRSGHRIVTLVASGVLLCALPLAILISPADGAA